MAKIDLAYRRGVLRAFGAAGAAWTLRPNQVGAQSYPGSRTVKLLVGSPAGATTDQFARALAASMGQALNGTIIVENVPGASGTIGAARAARSEPDGHTLVIGFTSSHGTAPALTKNLSYHPVKDFTPIGLAATLSWCIVANPSVPANNLAELLALARTPNSNLMYGTWGIGSSAHLLMERITSHGNAKMQMVPYKGEGPAFQAAMAGEIPLSIAAVGTTLPFVKAGKVKILGVIGMRRHWALPDVPTVAEQGIPLRMAGWLGLMGPAGLPAAIVQPVTRALDETRRSPEFVERARTFGWDVEALDGDAFAKWVSDDVATWAELVKLAGVQAQ